MLQFFDAVPAVNVIDTPDSKSARVLSIIQLKSVVPIAEIDGHDVIINASSTSD